MKLPNTRYKKPNQGEDSNDEILAKRFLVIGVALLIVGAFGAAALAVAPEQVIKITAKKFEYNPQRSS